MRFLYFTLLIFFIWGCRSTKVIQYSPDLLDNEFLDTLVVRADRIQYDQQGLSGIYRTTANRKIDLIHTSLDLAIDWKNRSLAGTAILDMMPYFNPVGTVELDAVSFDVHRVWRTDSETTRDLEFVYDGWKIRIDLDRAFEKGERFTLGIDYTAYPEKNANSQAFAIGSDQGFFFIDPDGTHPGKPTQIWTQGETEYNSRWFPTIDKPNERCTQELKITVPDSLVTLSNGILVKQEPKPGEMRTDHWKLDLPHAPYLFAVIAGDYAVVRDTWNGKELGYYVYPEYRDHARAIFDHTPEMLDFFSDKTGVPYPWPKYSQVIVSDFVSGAMENTGSVIYAESFQKTREDLVDYPNDMIVAHEMAHHWFGNLVTCESWSNITLNEGFANYAEYLWKEYQHGYAEAEMNRHGERFQYLQTASRYTRPLIDFTYDNKDAMFDIHSYNKGGLILHMLRNYLGDAAFFAGVKHYLESHAFQSVEVHDLRLSFEAVSGEDLNWFFNQWFFDKGHPKIRPEYSFSETDKALLLNLEQFQDSLDHRPLFQFPLSVQLIFKDGTKRVETIWMNRRNQTFTISCDEEPRVVLFNIHQTLLCEVDVEYSKSEWAFIYDHADHPVLQFEAIRQVSDFSLHSRRLKNALRHKLWQIRSETLRQLSSEQVNAWQPELEQMAQSDENPLVRARVLRLLSKNDLLEERMVFSRLEKDSSANVLAFALNWLDFWDHAKGEIYASRYLDNPSRTLSIPVASILSKTENERYLPYFEKRIFSDRVFMISFYLDAYSKLLQSLSADIIVDQCQRLSRILNEMDETSDFEKGYYLRVIEQQVDELTDRLAGMEKDSAGWQDMKESIKKLQSLQKRAG